MVKCESNRCPSPCRKVGIIADSHGQPRAIADAIDVLRQKGCGPIYHLGDVCDSFLPETSGSCVDLLLEKGVSAVKGNNDYAIVINHVGQEGTVVSGKTLEFLQGLPAVLEYEGAILTHSLPFVGELGLSSMIGVMNEEWAKRFFNQFPEGILFRGHGHTPRIRWSDRGELLSEILEIDHAIDLADRIPCVVTCGALTDGLCMVWDTEGKGVTCVSFN